MTKNCEVNPFDGINRTANQLEIINKKTGAYTYLSSPRDDLFYPRRIIERACIQLGVELPLNY